MVRLDQSGLFEVTRWGGFLTLSLILNFYVLTLIKLPVPVIEVPIQEIFRISFKSLAAPKSNPGNKTPQSLKTRTELKKAEKLIPLNEILKPVKHVPKIVLPVQTLKTAKKKINTAPPIKMKKVAQNPKIPTPRLLTKKLERSPAVKVAEVKKPVITIKTAVQTAKKTDIKHPPKTPSKSVANNRGTQVSTVIHKAHYRDRTPPIYPRRAYELGQQGLVMLHALVAVDGLAKKLKVETSSGHRMLDLAALAAVKKWEFEPPIRNGHKIQSWVSVPVRFVIQ
ncbi:MAG: energy transducer TonB [Sneathiella sp.]|nr:energy transducer TonB [Sneathiella sp.]